LPPRAVALTPMRKIFHPVLLTVGAAFCAGACFAQPYRTGLGGYGGYGGGGAVYPTGNPSPIVRTESGGDLVNEDTVRTARETAGHSVDLPEWKNPKEFDQDVFTYARIIFKSTTRGITIWVNDYPDSDLNLSARLHRLTSMKVDPDGRVLKLTSPELRNFPLLFGSQPGYMILRDDEVLALRTYLLNGGALVVDDFWGATEWSNFAAQMQRVLPGRNWSELPVTHPLFHCVYDLKGTMSNIQVPTINYWNRSYDPADPESRASRQRNGIVGTDTMQVRSWCDDKGRIMVLALHNTDNGDGWEREGENPDYFDQFSKTRAYPLAINIIYYLMTH